MRIRGIRDSGDMARRKGIKNEGRVIGVLQSCSFPGVETFRQASKAEEERGVDVVIYTIYGTRIFIQVKSSFAGRRAFEQRRKEGRYSEHIFVVLANCRDTDLAARVRHAVGRGIQRHPRIRTHSKLGMAAD